MKLTKFNFLKLGFKDLGKKCTHNNLFKLSRLTFTNSVEPTGEINRTKKGKAKNINEEKEKTFLFKECELRVGKVVDLTNMENSEDIYCLKVDVGEGNLRDIGAGLRKYVTPIEIKETKVIVFCNLKPRKLGLFMSNGMLLCGSNEGRTLFELLRPNINANVGERVILEDNSNEDENAPEQLNDKKLKKILALLKTDVSCIGTFNNIKMKTESGYLACKTLKNCQLS